MKTTLSKSLLCGIIASTFLLANCQKAPSGRTVKAEVGNPGPVTDANKATVADKDLNLVLCTPAFTKVYTDYYTSLTTVTADVDKTVEVTESRKADLLRFRKDLEDKVKPVMDELNNLKSEAKTATGELKKVDGCFSDATKKTIYTPKIINDNLNVVDSKITKLTGEKSARSEAAAAAQAATDAESKRLAKGITYKVSAEFNELLDEPMSSTSKHFVDGKIAEKSELEVNKKNVKAAVCEIVTANGKLADDQLMLKTLGEESAKQENKKNIYSVNLGQLANQGDKVIRITCSLPTDMKKHAGFEKAMGTYLIAQKIADVGAGDDDLARIKARSESAQAMAADDAKKVEADAKATADQKAKDDAKAANDQKAKDEADKKAAADKAAVAPEKAADAASVEESGT